MPNLPFRPRKPADDDATAHGADALTADALVGDALTADPLLADAVTADALLDSAGAVLPRSIDGSAEADVAGVAEVLRLAAAAPGPAEPPDPTELAAESAALAAFRHEVAARRPRLRTAAFAGGWAGFPSRLTRRAATCLAAGAVTLTGAASAYACVLPAPIQSFAHHTIAAPAPAQAAAVREAAHPATTPSTTGTRSTTGAAAISGVGSRSTSAAPSPAKATATRAATPPASADLAKRLQQLRELAASRLCADLAAATKAGAVLDSPEQAALDRLAGGAGVNAYCATIPVQPQPTCVRPGHARLDPSSHRSTPDEGWWGRCGCPPGQAKTSGKLHDLCDLVLGARPGVGHQPSPGPTSSPRAAAPSGQPTAPTGSWQHPRDGTSPWPGHHGFGAGGPTSSPRAATG